MAKLRLTIALDRYDRHAPLFDGSVAAPEGVELDVLAVGQGASHARGSGRHRRMYPGGEFDVAEYGLSPYVIAKSRTPDLPIVALPVFPRRLFSQSRMVVNVDAGIEAPQDLAGKTVGVNSFQNTLAVQAKGDLACDFGVGWRDINWMTAGAEHFRFEPGPELTIERLAAARDAGEMLLRGELDALFTPHCPAALLGGDRRVRPLFADPKAEIVRYFRRYGFYPIMHLVVVRRELLDREPGLGRTLCELFETAKRMTYDDYRDPNYSILAWGRQVFEEQREALGEDAWPSGLAANRSNLARFIGYCHDQRLIEAPYPVEDLFHESVRDT